MQVLVLGAGVIGLTTAIHLRRQGHEVALWAKAISPGTTSDVAAAFWYPYAAYPADAVARWAKQSYGVFAELSETAETGIVATSINKYFKGPVEEPAWREAVIDYEEFKPRDRTDYLSAFRFSTWIIDMTRYMPYLKQVWKDLGGRVAFQPVVRFDDVPAQYKLIVNCTGFGARELTGDMDLIAARGRVVRMKKFNSQPQGILLDAGHELFGMIVPRADDIVLGGTYEENQEDCSIDEKANKAIIARCAQLWPALGGKNRKVLGSACGLRPVRSVVRLELERISQERSIIHNYGHGGAGVTLSWGCAGDVAALVEQVQLDRPGLN